MPKPLPVLPENQPRPVECTECGRCCTYVAIEIEEPTRPKHATHILWYLYHDNVSVYVDGNNEWCVQFTTRCRNLKDDLLCRIYPVRPHICRGFDNQTCEVNGEGESFTFNTPEQFLDYLKVMRPRVYDMIRKRYLPEALGGSC
jgi:uncharacterized protein